MNYFLQTFLCCILIIFCFSKTKAQSKSKLIHTKYEYSFSGDASMTTIENLTQEISSLKGVTQCKPTYKTDVKKGQLIVFVEEMSRTSEDDVLFEPTDLKKIIIKNGLVPDELTFEELVK